MSLLSDYNQSAREKLSARDKLLLDELGPNARVCKHCGCVFYLSQQCWCPEKVDE